MNEDLQFSLSRLSFSDLEFTLKYAQEHFNDCSRAGHTYKDLQLKEKAEEYKQLVLAVDIEISHRIEGLLSEVKEQVI